MTFSPTELIAGGTIIATVAAMWGSFRFALRDQGRRIGRVEKEVSQINGYLTGARYRRQTKPQGEEKEP